jgi:hypothetical protein
MPNQLPLPDDLNHLIEKRSGQDRRETSRQQEEDDDGKAKADRRKIETQSPDVKHGNDCDDLAEERNDHE